MRNAVLKVEGMSCGHCVNAVESAVRELGAKASVDLNEGLVSVEYEDSKLSLETIKEAIEERGYSAAA